MGIQVSYAKPISPLRAMESKPAKKEQGIEWKRAKEIAEYLHVSIPTVSKWTSRANDPLPHRRLAGVLQYDFEKVKEWEERNTN